MHGITPDETALILTSGPAALFIVVVAGIGIWLLAIGTFMQTAAVFQFRVFETEGMVDALGREHAFGPMPELPRPTQRWTVRRKAAVIAAVRGGWVPIEEACELYDISVDEFLAWERDLDRYGIHGLRTTRYQIYRDTEARYPDQR